jgi:hypothetical protein
MASQSETGGGLARPLLVASPDPGAIDKDNSHFQFISFAAKSCGRLRSVHWGQAVGAALGHHRKLLFQDFTRSRR